MAIRDNYEPRVTITETETPEEQKEIHDFLISVLDTPVMLRAEKFLRDKSKNTKKCFSFMLYEFIG